MFDVVWVGKVFPKTSQMRLPFPHRKHHALRRPLATRACLPGSKGSGIGEHRCPCDKPVEWEPSVYRSGQKHQWPNAQAGGALIPPGGRSRGMSR
jgi:hypothetical protein